jgi:hypothetical protein
MTEYNEPDAWIELARKHARLGPCRALASSLARQTEQHRGQDERFEIHVRHTQLYRAWENLLFKTGN